MWELFGVIFATLGFIFELQEGFGLPSGAPKGVFVLFVDFGCDFGSILDPFWHRLWVIVSTHFRERSRSDLGASPDGFGSHFGSILAPFWEYFGSPFEQ